MQEYVAHIQPKVVNMDFSEYRNELDDLRRLGSKRGHSQKEIR